MKDPLAIYIHDHLAGSVAGVNLVEGLRDRHAGEPLGEFAEGLLVELKADQDVLNDLAEQLGAGANPLKEATAWVGEKMSRMKLGGGDNEPLSDFESLEALALGILGKLSLWQALAEIATGERELQNLDLAQLISRAQDQYARVEARRREAARTALRASM